MSNRNYDRSHILESNVPPGQLPSSSTSPTLSLGSSTDMTTTHPNRSTSTTIYVPMKGPPTPSPSPGPESTIFRSPELLSPYPTSASCFGFSHNPPSARLFYISTLLSSCTHSELLFISNTITALLKRDFLHDMPSELALYILSFIDEPRTLARASQVSRRWKALLEVEGTWKRMCNMYRFRREDDEIDDDPESSPHKPRTQSKDFTVLAVERSSHLDLPPLHDSFSFRNHFKTAFRIHMNWRHGGHLLRSHRSPATPPSNGIVTSIAIDSSHIVLGLASSHIHVFCTTTGVLRKTLAGHESGVWAVNLVSQGGRWVGTGEERDDALGDGEHDPSHLLTPTLRAAVGLDSPRQSRSRSRSRITIGSTSQSNLFPNSPVDPPPLEQMLDPQSHSSPSPSLTPRLNPKPQPVPTTNPESEPEPQRKRKSKKLSDPCSASEGWGQPNSIIISGGCDKVLRVWDIKSGSCIYVLQGHTSTIRCLKVLHNRPIAVSGSRDCTLRVWNVQRGRLVHVLEGHTESVRTLDVCGNQVVSGSYDCTCRLWDVDTGDCLQVFRGHYHQIYSVVFDGERIASGGLDTMVRIWDAATGNCLAMLQGHTALVCQLQLFNNTLATSGSDGRVIIFSLTPSSSPSPAQFALLRRISAHDSSVTSLQFDDHFVVTGSNDGHVRLFDTQSGEYVRDLTDRCESVWKVAYKEDVCVIVCKRAGKTVMEIWSFKPTAE